MISCAVTRDTLQPHLLLHWLFDRVPNYYDLGILLILKNSGRGLWCASVCPGQGGGAVHGLPGSHWAHSRLYN